MANSGRSADLTPEMEPYSWVPPAGDSSVVFASPHSGRFYPSSFLDLLKVPLIDLRRVEDAYVDRLISEVDSLGIGRLEAHFARSYVDLNRAEEELDSRMFRDGPPTPAGERTPRVEAGLGCIPRIAASGEDIHARKLKRSEAENRLDLAYRPYHDRLTRELERLRQNTGLSVLVDCHSMPSQIGGRRIQADMIIGTRHGSACDESLVRVVEGCLSQLGYRTLRNQPYAGGFVTKTHGNPLEDAQAIQIEINRKLYLDESRVELLPGWTRLQRNLYRLGERVLSWAEQKKAAPKKVRRKS